MKTRKPRPKFKIGDIVMVELGARSSPNRSHATIISREFTRRNNLTFSYEELKDNDIVWENYLYTLEIPGDINHIQRWQDGLRPIDRNTVKTILATQNQ